MIRRRLLQTSFVLSALLFASTAARAQVSCIAAAASQQTLRQEGFTEPAGDILISCTGSPSPSGPQAAAQSIRLTIDNTSLTSRVLGPDVQSFGAPTEVALLTNDCTSNGSASGSGCLSAGSYQGGNPIQGRLINGGVVFNGVSFPVAGVPFTFRITNLRVAANQLAAGGIVTASLQSSFTIQNAQNLAIGTVQKSLSVAPSPSSAVLQQCQTPGTINLVISELFSTAFKSPRVTSGNGVPGGWYQNVNSESQFAFFNWNQAEWSNPSSSSGVVPGQADTATRIRVNFSNIPANVTLSLPSSLSTASGTLVAISSDTGPTSIASGPITISSPSGSVTYEVQSQSMTAVDSFNVPIGVTYTNTPDLGTIQVSATYVPTTSESTTSYPYFADTSSTTTPLATVVTCLSLTSLNPSTVPANSPQFVLQVKGTGFLPTSVIIFNGTPLTNTLYQDTTTLLAVISPSLLTTAGSVPVTVMQQGVPLPSPLTFIITTPLSLTSLSPPSASAGGPQFTLTLNGTGFTSQTSAFFNSTQLTTTVVSANQLTAIVPASLIAQAATVPVTARTGSQTSNAINFIVTSPSLTLTSISPGTVAAGSPAFVLTAIGTGFTTGSAITVNGSVLSSTFISPTQLTTTVPANFVASPSTLAVSIFQQGFTPPPSLPLTVTNSTFSLISITPASATAGGPQFTLLASGTGFNTGTVLFFNSTALATQFISSGQLSATVPAASIAQPGTVSVTANNNGVSSNALPFSITQTGLTLTSISPNTAIAGSPQFTMILTGTGFNTGTVATFNGTALSASFVNANQLTALVPATLLTTVGTVAVGVTSPGQTPPPALPFTITTPVLSLINLSPSTIAAGAQGFTMGVTGTAFTSSTVILWNGSALPTTFGSSTSLSVAVPTNLLANAGTASVTAQNGSTTSNSLTFTISAPPPPPTTLISVTPNTAAAGSQALTITVTGSGFVPPSGTAVTFNGTTLTTTVVSRTQLTATVPASLLANPGVAAVSVTGSQPTPASLPFTITTGPVLISLNPSSTTAGGPGLTLTATGTGFTSGTTLNLNGTAVTTSFISPTQLSASISATQIQQPATLSVTASNGTQVSNSLPFNVLPPTPVITSLTPSSAVTGAPALSMTIAGSGYLATSTASWNGIPLPVTFVSSTQLTAAIGANLLSAPGKANVVVANGTLVSNAAVFTVVPPAPVITSISPASVVAGGAAFTLNVSGTGFISGAAVSLGGSTVPTNFISDTQVTAAVPATAIAQTGTVQVSLTNPTGQGSNSVPLTITPFAPTITSLSPSTAIAGGPAFSLSVTGTGFLSGATVSFNGTNVNTSFISATQLTAAITADLIAQAGKVSVTASNPNGGTSNAVTFTITPPTPVLTSLSPASVTVNGPAFTLTLNGTGFLSGATASLAGTSLTTTFVSATQLTAAVPATLIQKVGPLAVTAANPGGASSNSLNLAVNPPVPTITSLAPSSVTAGGPAFTLTVTGTNFLPGAVVSINGSALATTDGSATQVTAQVTATQIAQAGPAQITVANVGGQSSAPATLNVNPGAPTLTSISPISAKVGDATFTLAITGTGFVQGSVVQWDGSPLATTFVSNTQLTATIAAGRLILPATASVTVVNAVPGGSPLVSNALTFTINPVLPTITTISPNSATAGDAAFSLTVNGTGLINLTTIQFNSTALTTHFVSATQVTADVPATLLVTPGTVSVTAVNPGNNVSNAVTFTINVGTPAVLTSLSKTTATVGDAAFTLTITGTGFRSGAVANLGTTALSTTFVSATQLTAAVPTTALATAGTLQVTVTQFGATSNGLPFVIAPPGPPALRLVAPGTITPGQQTTIDFGLNSPYPLALTGTVTLTFVSNATVPIDDPAIQLATGGRVFTFTVPANTTALPALQLQTGTVAGTITIAVTFSAGGVNVTPASGNTATIIVPKAAPVLISGKVKLIHQNGYLEVDITGFSTTRDMTSATFHLNPVAGGSFTSSDFTIPLTGLFTTWYQSAASTAFGGQFSYAQPFTVIGDTNQVQSVTVTLTNSAGASVSMTTN